jgi:hypothetical protein
MVNLGARVLVARLYQSILKYPNYKKDVDLDAHVKVFILAPRVNGKHLKST